MFARDHVLLRPVDWPDRDDMYRWQCDSNIEILTGWGPRQSRTTYETRFRRFLEDPPDDLKVFAIEWRDALAGRIELYDIDREHRRASLGLYLGDRDNWGKGIGSAAVVILLDYSFSVLNLGRVCAYTYAFNPRSRRLMHSVGFVEEGLLREHEIHNGAARDMCVFGMLAREFFARYETLFPLPK
jgi:RimJ/RimL family protein N-acetyltransferase